MQHHFTNTVAISRAVVTGNKTTFAEISTGVPCHIQPLTGQLANGQWGRLQKEYLCFCETELRIGDKLVDNAGKEYEVFGLQELTWRGRTHYEAQLRGV